MSNATKPRTSPATAKNGRAASNGHASVNGNTNGRTDDGDRSKGRTAAGSSSDVVQDFDTVRDMSIGLDDDTRAESCRKLNAVLADSVFLAALYKKCHWLMRGVTFYQLHLLLDKHADEQYALVDELAERVQKLGGIAVGDPRHAAELTDIPRPPDGAQDVPSMLRGLLRAHELTLARVRDGIEATDENEDDGSNDLLVSQVLRTNETQVWYITEHLDASPLLDGARA